MAGDFHDHPRKKVIREQWNTPLLRQLYERWRRKYVYCGLPGPQALDVKLWKDMIATVIAFEVEQESGDPRRHLVELKKQLQLLGIKNQVYCGPIEDVVLRRRDHDGRDFNLVEFVTLYNLDFCNAITGKIVIKGGRRCLRFETLRQLTALQRHLYCLTGSSRFVLLITVRDSFHIRQVRDVLEGPEAPGALRDFFLESAATKKFGNSGIVAEETDCLKLFVFAFLRKCLRGQNVRSVFLPPIAYVGHSEDSPMLHFTVVCDMGSMEDASTEELQPVESFFELRTLRATDNGIVQDPSCQCGSECICDPIELPRRFGFLPE